MDREKIDAKYKWDLESIYKNDKEYDEDLKKIKELSKDIEKYRGRVLESPSSLLEVLEKNIKLGSIINKLYVYDNLHYTLDTRNGLWSSKINSLTDTYSKIDANLSFIVTELSKLDEDMLLKFMEEEPKLKAYEFTLRDTIKHNKHILGEESEALLSTLSPVLSVGASVFDKIDNADINLGTIKNGKGETLELTPGLYQEYASSKDAVLRKNAFYGMHEYYKNHANAISECLLNNVKENCIISKLRKYDSPLEASLMSDNIPVKFYKDLINNIHKNLPLLHRMMSILKKGLNLKEMHIYDINARIGDVPNKNYSIEEIQNTVRESLKVMGEDYIKVVDKAFNENWVDYYETPGKTSGAFSSGSYDTKAYILLNYTGSFDNIETLAHELGHSIHSYYSNKNNSRIDADYPIFLAEIASTTHEVLLNNYLLKNADNDEEKKYILNNILSNFKSTVFRQLEFAEFEMIIHERVQNGENLTKDDFTSIYYDLEKLYYGEDVKIDDIARYEALRIPHFYTSFYVYKYATGLSIAYKFASDILDNKPNAKSNYIKFISSGGKDYPFNILKSCGIDLDKEDIVGDAMKLINKYLDEFEHLIDKE